MLVVIKVTHRLVVVILSYFSSLDQLQWNLIIFSGAPSELQQPLKSDVKSENTSESIAVSALLCLLGGGW